jgi:histidyl-tRNA synthetase
LPWPAVGFSLSLDRLAQRVDDRKPDIAKELPVTTVKLKKERSKGLAEALRLRKQGVKVRID